MRSGTCDIRALLNAGAHVMRCGIKCRLPMKHLVGAVLLIVTMNANLRADGPTSVPLEVRSTVDVRSLGGTGFTLPAVCAEDGAILVRSTAFGSIGDVVAIDKDGVQKASYPASSASDITQPRAIAFFPRGKYLYLLVRGYKGSAERRTLRRPDGTTETQLSYERAAFYVAKYEANGDYRGSVELDLPFRPAQLGVFESGDFLLAGASGDRQHARVAMLRSNGQFIKFLDIEGDAALKNSENAQKSPGVLPERGKRFGEGFMDIVLTSVIAADGPRLLLVRRGTNLPVFTITAGGEVNAVKLQAPADFNLMDIKSTRDAWIVAFTHRISGSGGLETTIRAIDPQTGKATQTYTYSRAFGLWLACANGREFTLLMKSGEAFKILTLQPSTSMEPKSPTE